MSRKKEIESRGGKMKADGRMKYGCHEQDAGLSFARELKVQHTVKFVVE